MTHVTAVLPDVPAVGAEVDQVSGSTVSPDVPAVPANVTNVVADVLAIANELATIMPNVAAVPGDVGGLLGGEPDGRARGQRESDE